MRIAIYHYRGANRTLTASTHLRTAFLFWMDTCGSTDEAITQNKRLQRVPVHHSTTKMSEWVVAATVRGRVLQVVRDVSEPHCPRWSCLVNRTIDGVAISPKRLQMNGNLIGPLPEALPLPVINIRDAAIGGGVDGGVISRLNRTRTADELQPNGYSVHLSNVSGWPKRPGNFYEYAFDIIEISAVKRQVWFCGNSDSGVIRDSIFTRQAEWDAKRRQWVYGQSTLAMPHGANDPVGGYIWDRQHACDPDVVAALPGASFRLRGQGYQYAMFYVSFWSDWLCSV